MNWKHFANWVKFAIVIEMAIMFIFMPTRAAWDIIQIGLCQYALFFPVDASIIIKNIRGDPPKES